MILKIAQNRQKDEKFLQSRKIILKFKFSMHF